MNNVIKCLLAAMILVTSVSTISATADDEHLKGIKSVLHAAVEKKYLVMIKGRNSASSEIVKIEKCDDDSYRVVGSSGWKWISSLEYAIPLFGGKKVEMVLIDKSTLQGEVGDVDTVKNTITFITKHKKYTITMDKVLNIKMFQDEVTVVLKDGSRFKGILINDDGREITLKTILGAEKFKRSDVLRIDYK